MIYSNSIEILSDPMFKTGFHCMGVSPVIDKRQIECYLDYSKKAEASKRKIWHMAQWWTPYQLKDASYSYLGNMHFYQTPSRTIGVNYLEGKLFMALNGLKEYRNKPRTSMDIPWPHLLIEQDFERSYDIFTIESLTVNLNFNIHKVVDENKDLYNPNLHAAQLLWYFVITDVSDNFGEYQGYENSENFFWFGVPLYDSRKAYIEESKNVDLGGIGTTGRLIYSMDSRLYLPENISFNKEYSINIDILPDVLKAYNYAIENGYLKKHPNSNFQIGYMNFGWELPGAFDVSSTIWNMSTKIKLKQ